MTPDFIFHICDISAWKLAKEIGHYGGSDLDRRDGFIHFSTREQVVDTAKLHLAGRRGLVLLEVDVKELGIALKWEKSRNGHLFPHLYGKLPIKAVRNVHELHLGDGGIHIFPPGI
ncbi:MAG: DUF952 domain-containing protein [Alphaproteobacteria bacterium]